MILTGVTSFDEEQSRSREAEEKNAENLLAIKSKELAGI
jgi:hypothetical protein